MDFTRRAIDNFFRHWLLFALPILMIGAFGAYSAAQADTEYRSTGTVSASRNPLVNQPEIRGTQTGSFESAAGGAARLIREQLSSDTFVDDVADRAGLVASLDAELITRSDIRAALSTTVIGQSYFQASATWDDPDVAFRLVNATIDAYLDELALVAANDSREAVQFWERAESDAQARVDAAEAELIAFLEANPSPSDGADRPVEQELAILRLNSAITQAEQDVQSARTSIDAANLAVDQAESAAGRPLRVVDEPEVPRLPEGKRLGQLLTLTTFVALSLIVTLAALVVSTALDRSLRSPSQLRSLAGTGSVATAGWVRSLKASRWNRTRRRKAAA